MPSYLPLIFANIIPVFFIIHYNWDVGPVILLYWAENLIIGLFQLCRIWIAPVRGGAAVFGKFFLSLFFLIHFGGFCAIHGIFVFAFLSIGQDMDTVMTGATGGNEWSFAWGPLIFIGLLFSVVKHFLSTASVETLFSVLALFMSHGWSFVVNHWLSGEYKQSSKEDLMTAPYKRVMILHFVILIGGFAVMSLKSPVPLVILLVIIKILMDIKFHLDSHRHIEKPDHKQTEEIV